MGENLKIPRNRRISLVLDDIVLQDERTLADSGVVEGSVLNLVIEKRTWLEALREEASTWTCDGRPCTGVELVPHHMHTNLLAGKGVTNLKTTLCLSGFASHYHRSSVKRLLSNVKMISDVLGD